MSEDQDKSQKTEEPTERKLQKSREEGKLFSSREVSNFLAFVTAAVIFYWLMPKLGLKVYGDLFNNLARIGAFVDPDEQGNLALLSFVRDLLADLFLPLLAVTIPFMISGIVSSIVQHGFIYSPQVIMPSLDRISLLKGAKKIFSVNSLVEMIKGLVKIIIVGWALYRTIWPEINNIFTARDFTAVEIMRVVIGCSCKMLVTVAIIMFFLAIADYLYQRYKYYSDMMMTKQEIKDEYKQSEGDPHIKRKIKQIARQRIRANLRKAVKESTVVVTNPTHYSVAIKYDEERMGAPIVTAKGVDDIALEIRKIAKDNGIPIVENKTLAQGLYADIKVDEEITHIYYQMVANVINYVYRLSQSRGRN